MADIRRPNKLLFPMLINARIIEQEIVKPDAKPSKPSSQFIAFIVPINQILVIKKVIKFTNKIFSEFINKNDKLFSIFIP